MSVLLVAPRALVVAAALALVGGGVAAWKLQGHTAAKSSTPVATAARGDVVVTVGGVGRIGEATPAAQISLPSSGSAGAAGGSAAPATPGPAPASSSPGVSSPDAVFPHTSGRVSRLLVSPGQHIAAGRPLAVLDDGGNATGVVLQAQNELATALVELQQKR